MRTILDAEALTQWAALALDGMKTHRRAIDALNVFPVPDGDTGTNMYLTLEAGRRGDDGHRGRRARSPATPGSRRWPAECSSVPAGTPG